MWGPLRTRVTVDEIAENIPRVHHLVRLIAPRRRESVKTMPKGERCRRERWRETPGDRKNGKERANKRNSGKEGQRKSEERPRKERKKLSGRAQNVARTTTTK